MILECAGEVIANAATPADIDRALAKPRQAGWYLNLTTEDGDYFEVRRDDAGNLKVAYQERGSVRDAKSAVSDTRLRTALLSYLAHDGHWKRICEWPAPPPETPWSSLMSSVFGPPETRKKPDAPMPVLIVATGIGILLTILPWIPTRFLPLRLLPDFIRDEGALPVLLIFLAMPTLLIVALVSKLFDARQAAHWPQAQGRIVKSTVEAKHLRNMDGQSRVTNVPAIAYEFTASGFPRRGTRIAISEDTGGANTEATLAHYPVGANVVVHYNPKDPNDCVLDYSGPFAGMGKGCITSLVSLAVMIALGYAAYRNFDKLVAALPKDASPKVMLIAAFCGLVALKAFFTDRRSKTTTGGWPRTPGRVTVSTVESYVKTVDRSLATFYSPVVEYAYTVRGHEFRGRQIHLNWSASGSQSSAAATAAQYPVGREVEVVYDPANPEHAALTADAGSSWPLLVAAVIGLAIAVYASGMLR